MSKAGQKINSSVKIGQGKKSTELGWVVHVRVRYKVRFNQSRSISMLMTAYDECIVVSVTPEIICSLLSSQRCSSELR